MQTSDRATRTSETDIMNTVMIIGGGIGGLCLAHGLKRDGLPVDVYERTTERADWLQGYRINLRAILLDGLDDELHLGKAFERYEIGADGRVTAHFGDGSTATADLLVGADGANSRVRKQLLPHAERVDTGVVAVAGKYRLTPDTPLPRALQQDANIVIPHRRGMLFTAVWHADRTGRDRDDYAFWAYADAADQFPPAPEAMDGRAP